MRLKKRRSLRRRFAASAGQSNRTDRPARRKRPVSNPLRHAARQQGLPVACAGIKYEASEELRALCDSFEWVGVAKLGRMIRAFKRAGTSRVVMAGKVTKNVIYTPWRVLQLCPDLRTLQWWYRRTRRQSR